MAERQAQRAAQARAQPSHRSAARSERELAISAPTPPPCWICSDPATTAEHKLKRSDAKASFGTLTQQKPAYVHDDAQRNQRIQTLGAPLLTFKNPLCARCNNERTQAHDNAWEKLSAALRARRSALREGGFVRTNRVFHYDTRRKMLAVHLYFVKLMLGTIVDGNANFDRGPFQRAILDNIAQPNIHLKFGLLDGLDGRVVASGSNLEVQYYAGNKHPAFASWLYEPGSGIAIMVMFAADGEVRDGLDGAWHPKLATTRLRISNFNN